MSAATFRMAGRPGPGEPMSAGTFRVVCVTGIVLISVLGVVAFALVFLGGHDTDRSVVLFTAILGFLGPTVASLLVLLRTDENAERMKRLHDDVLNGPLRDNVKRAISEDRHRKRNEATAKLAQRQMRQRTAKRQAADDDEDD